MAFVAATAYLVAGLTVYLNDAVLFAKINAEHSAVADRLLGAISGFGDGLIVAMILGGVLLVRPYLGLLGLASYACSGLIAQALKHAIDRPRPAAVFSDVHLLGDRLVAHSFPSGHATSIGVLMALLPMLFGWRDWRTWLGIFVLLLAAYGRVYGGVHYPFDVWVGLGIGVFTTALLHLKGQRYAAHPWVASEMLARVAAIAVVVMATWLLFGYPIQPTTAQPMGSALATLGLIWVFWCWFRRRS